VPQRRSPEARPADRNSKKLILSAQWSTVDEAEQHALKASPSRIAALNEEVRRLEHLLADADFYARDRTAFAVAGAQLANAQAELAAEEEDWLRLELPQEEIQGG
jgi:ABC transport system ATP-binding/permease protein